MSTDSELEGEVESGPGGLVVEHDRDRTRSLFYAFVTLGLIVALVLGIRDVIVKPVIELDDVRGSDAATRPIKAQVLAVNTSEETTYCVTITLTVADTEGLTLRSATATPTTGDGRLPPGRSANFTATFDDLTDKEIDEELSDYFAFVTSADPC